MHVHACLRRYTEDADTKREAANDAWMFSMRSGKWTQVHYASGDVPRVSAIGLAISQGFAGLLQSHAVMACGAAGAPGIPGSGGGQLPLAHSWVGCEAVPAHAGA